MPAVPLGERSMLDFSKLVAPVDHGRVLVEPRAAEWLDAARENHAYLSAADTPLLGATLAVWRRWTREALVGDGDPLVFVLGHQPELFHPGVWAKRVAASRAAAAADGAALNLVVDNDAPRRTGLLIPTLEEGRLNVRHVSLGDSPTGHAYESFPHLSARRVAQFASEVREALDARYVDSQMPTLIEAMSEGPEADDWVDQVVKACRAVERPFGLAVTDRRISTTPCTPLLIDMFLHADRFASCYNNALASYRRTHRIRGTQRPIPDLQITDDRREVPVWAYRTDGLRRRVYVAKGKGRVRLYADDVPVGEIPIEPPSPGGDLESVFAHLPDWRFRPRVLALTLWARLLLADLFIHGIGGAKYDRISDAIMADYYRVDPPHIACVSATLHLNLPYREVIAALIQQHRRAIRDLTFNPQRNLDAGPDIAPLIEQRAAAVQRSMTLRKHTPRDAVARRAAFESIRTVNGKLLHSRDDIVDAKRNALAQAIVQFEQGRIARGREYFYGLYDQTALETLTNALPAKAGFRV